MCEFGNLRDRLIRDRLVIGIIRDSARERLLSTASLDLPKAVEICKTAEATKEQMMMKQRSGDMNVRHEPSKITDESGRPPSAGVVMQDAKRRKEKNPW